MKSENIFKDGYDYIIGYLALIISLSAFKDELTSIRIDFAIFNFSLADYFLVVILTTIIIIHLYFLPEFIGDKISNKQSFDKTIYFITYFILFIILVSPFIILLSVFFHLISSINIPFIKYILNFILFIISLIITYKASYYSTYRIFEKYFINDDDLKDVDSFNKVNININFKNNNYEETFRLCYLGITYHAYELLRKAGYNYPRRVFTEVVLRPENQKNIFKIYRSDLNKLGKIVIESNNNNIEISKEDAQFAYNLYNSFSNLENIK